MIKVIKKKWMYLLAGCVVALAACSDEDHPGTQEGNGPGASGKDDNAPEIVRYTHANLVYRGQAEEDASCLFELSLYTDMELNYDGNPIGPGKIMRLSMNAPSFEKDATEFPLPEGSFTASPANYVFNEWTFNTGYTYQMDLPTGKIEVNGGTFYGDVQPYSTEYEADLLDVGKFNVKKNPDGTYTVDGWAAGNSSLKHHLLYTGELKTIDRHESTEEVPNSTITEDILLTTLTKARLQDQGNYYWLEEEDRIRVFTLYLAEEGVNLEKTWAADNGKVLKIELFVEWETDVNQGIPAGTYTVTSRDPESNGILKENMIPFHIASGDPNRFTYVGGTWYQTLKEGAMDQEYARIDEGSMMVERGENGSHTLTIDFIDSNKEEPHHIRCIYTQDEPIAVFKNGSITN